MWIPFHALITVKPCLVSRYIIILIVNIMTANVISPMAWRILIMRNGVMLVSFQILRHSDINPEHTEAKPGPTWGPSGDRQDPGGPHVDPMNLAIWNRCPGKQEIYMSRNKIVSFSLCLVWTWMSNGISLFYVDENTYVEDIYAALLPC